LVDNDAIYRIAKRIKSVEIMDIPECQHEILMESDKFRTPFVERLFTFIKDNVLNGLDEGKTYIQ
jgi:alpha-beta hydrolase superfamily lysophospholipase